MTSACQSKLLAVLALVASSSVPAAEQSDHFESRIRPLLIKNCHTCHTTAQSGGLRLDSRSAVLKGGNSGPAIVPGKPDESLLIQAVRYRHDRLRMPPTGRLPPSEVADLERWVKDGAVWGNPFSPSQPDCSITEEQRRHWSFQPVKQPPLPAVSEAWWVRTPIDGFILAKLEEERLTPAPEADRRTLIRRATFDLTGLPPSPVAVEAFVSDESPRAFADVVDRLLESPRYGERWGRHWLDVVRYADTAGDSSDYPIPQMYLYRDYVIESFNKDKPYDEFIREQIAGDLMPSDREDQRWQRKIATGYLALSRRFGVRPEKEMHLTIEDTIDNLGKTFLGLTVGCARCHDHKFDPVFIKDYYGLYGIFASTRYPFAGSENDPVQKDLVYRRPLEQVEWILAPLRGELDALEEEINKRRVKRDELLDGVIAGEAVDTTRLVAAVKAYRGSIKKRRGVLARGPRFETAFAVAEGSPRNAHIQLRGDPKHLGEEVPRRFPEILGGQAVPPERETSGRLLLADWIADPENPLTARVMVNRIWQHHFGRGLVLTPNDFGRRGEAPTHPELLDYLAAKFVASGWSVKTLHRMIMLSRTYRMSSEGDDRNRKIDAANEYLWKFNRRRLSAEEILDSMPALSGELDLTSKSEPHPFPPQDEWSFAQAKPFQAVFESKRRSVYLMTQRFQKHPYLVLFDGADNNTGTAARLTTVTPIQALFAMNSEMVHNTAQGWAKRLMASAADDRARIEQAHMELYARPVETDELEKAQAHLERSHSLAGYLRVLLASNEFLFVD